MFRLDVTTGTLLLFLFVKIGKFLHFLSFFFVLIV
jgi:hypothetical protein